MELNGLLIPDRVSPTLVEDELVLSLIATGLVQLSEQMDRGKPFAYPYPLALQRGLDRLTVLRIRRGQSAPQSVPDLIRWCQFPIQEWQLNLPADSLGEHDTLLDGNRLTNVCESWACANADVEAELAERQFMKSVFDTCHTLNIPEAYTSFRRLLIERPVLTALEFQIVLAEPEFSPLVDQLHAAYLPAPANCLLQGFFYPCSNCGNLLIRTEKNELVCENERCQAHEVSSRDPVPEREQPVWLKRSLRRFVAAPGSSELRLAASIEERGLPVELWPMYDQYDLRVTFPDQIIWAIDVKDWANPFLLARSVQPIPPRPEWSRAFFVFPDERHRQRRDYLRAFQSNCSLLNNRVSALFEWQLLREIDQKLEG